MVKIIRFITFYGIIIRSLPDNITCARYIPWSSDDYIDWKTSPANQNNTIKYWTHISLYSIMKSNCIYEYIKGVCLSVKIRNTITSFHSQNDCSRPRLNRILELSKLILTFMKIILGNWRHSLKYTILYNL